VESGAVLARRSQSDSRPHGGTPFSASPVTPGACRGSILPRAIRDMLTDDLNRMRGRVCGEATAVPPGDGPLWKSASDVIL
jgi:hypothetical protein